MVKKSQLTSEYVGKLKLQADAYEKVALGLEGAAGDEALAKLERMRLEIDQLSAQTNLLGDKFRDIFVDSASDAFASFIDGTKSAKDAFKDFTNSVVRDIDRIVAKELANKLASSLFGSGTTTGPSAGSGDPDWMSMLVKLGMSYFTGGSGIGYGTAGSAIPAGPYPYANGTNFHPGGWAMVGERGRELVHLPRGAQVIPNHELMGMGGRWERHEQRPIVQTINVLPGASRQSAAQAADEMRRQLIQASRLA